MKVYLIQYRLGCQINEETLYFTQWDPTGTSSMQFNLLLWESILVKMRTLQKYNLWQFCWKERHSRLLYHCSSNIFRPRLWNGPFFWITPLYLSSMNLLYPHFSSSDDCLQLLQKICHIVWYVRREHGLMHSNLIVCQPLSWKPFAACLIRELDGVFIGYGKKMMQSD